MCCSVADYLAVFLTVDYIATKQLSLYSSTVNALINAPLKNNYDPQRRLVWSEKNYFGPMGAPYLGRRLRIRAQLTPFSEVERAEYE